MLQGIEEKLNENRTALAGKCKDMCVYTHVYTNTCFSVLKICPAEGKVTA